MATAFQLLPVEVNAQIAGLLDDADLCRFTLICPETHAAVNCQASPVWRRLFITSFDLHAGISNDKLKEVYQFRKKWLRLGAEFKTGRTVREQHCLLVMRSLIIESFVRLRDDNRSTGSHNVEALRRLVDNHNVMHDFLCPKYINKISPLLLTVQVMMMHFQLNRAIISNTLNFPVSQGAVYSSIKDEPMFHGKNSIEINMPLVAHTLNFFKHHLTRPEEAMYHTYKAMGDEKPKAWRKRLVDGAQALGKRWAGVYAFLEHDELQQLREADTHDTFFIDNFNGEGDGEEIQTLELDFHSEPVLWPNIFEHHLHSLSHPSATYLTNVQGGTNNELRPGTKRTRAQRRDSRVGASESANREPIDPTAVSFQFTGTGSDSEGFYANGWLNPLPPQQGIPGWQRMTMMKFFVDQDMMSAGEGNAKYDMATALAGMDETSLWAYEGVVLPGGEIILGRWWSTHQGTGDEMYSGPFMFWCID